MKKLSVVLLIFAMIIGFQAYYVSRNCNYAGGVVLFTLGFTLLFTAIHINNKSV
jgi:putative Mn2+ efflux pump MntP